MDFGEPIKPGHEPKPPERLDDLAAGVWRRLLPPLVSAAIVHETDLFAFTMLCETLAQVQRARREMRDTDDAQARRVLQVDIIDPELPLVQEAAQRFLLAGRAEMALVWDEFNRTPEG